MYNDSYQTAQTFGERLRVARENSGYDIETIARILHIRTDILYAIESSDFQKMPPSGYCRNMVRSYARQVGLNQNEICEQYLSELSTWERGNIPQEEYSAPSNQRRSTSRRSFLDIMDSGSTAPATPTRQVQSRQPNYDNIIASMNAPKQQRASATDRRQSFYQRYNTEPAQPHNTRQSQGFSVGAKPQVSLPPIDLKMVLLAVLGLIILIALVVVIVLALNKPQETQEQTLTMPISGLTDTQNQDTSAQEAQKRNFATIKVKVASGEASWCLITIDGAEDTNDVLTSTKTFKVTGTFKLQTANPSPLTITVDDEEQSLALSEESGYYEFNYEYTAPEEETTEEESSSDTSSTATPHGETNATISTDAEHSTAGAGTA